MSLLGKQIGNYKVEKLIGSGGMGSVYLGVHPLIGRKVAIKVLHPEMARSKEMVTRFFHEARAANDIRDPRIVDVLDLGHIEDEGADVVYLVMEYLEGESLKHKIAAGPLATEEIGHIADQIAAALAESHKKHIIHRDLKPDNIHLLHRDDDALFVKVLDFGIAKLLDATGSSNVTRAGAVLGTPEYMSPEQCDGQGQIDSRTDIYALGVMIYEMLTGKLPFSGTLRTVLLAQMTATPLSPTSINPECSPALASIAMRCLEKEKDQRFQSMEAIREALRLSGVPTDAILPVAARPTRRPLPSPSTPIPAHVSAEHAAGEVLQRAPLGSPKRRLGLFLGIGGGAASVIVVGVIVAIVASTHRPSNPSVPPPAPIAAAPVAQPIRVHIESEPEGAAVLRAGFVQPIGTTPLTLSLDAVEPGFEVRLTLDGYQPRQLFVEHGRSQSLRATLTPVPGPPPPPPTTTTTTTGTTTPTTAKTIVPPPTVTPPTPKAAAMPPPSSASKKSSPSRSSGKAAPARKTPASPSSPTPPPRPHHDPDSLISPTL